MQFNPHSIRLGIIRRSKLKNCNVTSYLETKHMTVRDCRGRLHSLVLRQASWEEVEYF